MNYLPDGVVQQILSHMSSAKEIAVTSCVSQQWNQCVPYLPSLFFPRGAFDPHPRGERPHPGADVTIGRMIGNAVRLEQLVIYCPFSPSNLGTWLGCCEKSLRVLELRMDGICEKGDGGNRGTILDCVSVVQELETLKLWGVALMGPPNWGCLKKLRTLEIVGASFGDGALEKAIHACPNLVELALLGCDGVSSLKIELGNLVKCRLDFLGHGDSYLYLGSPKLEDLEIQGFGGIWIKPNHRLKRLCIAKTNGRVYNVDVGDNLPDLESLSLRGVQWCWSAISSILRLASEVKHLLMKIEFCGDFEALLPFPEVDLVNFFDSHPKLRKFEIHGAMFAALCQKNSLINVNPKFLIPNLEEVLVIVRSPLNAEQKLNTLESLVKHSPKLRRMVIRISQMKNTHDAADDFFEEICKFKCLNNGIVKIE
ncbi:hypothetical protein LUZ60_002773 [Juncus effusus]|nr:hypothetical protein LUZ60_002773 [Juncus effusus]